MSNAHQNSPGFKHALLVVEQNLPIQRETCKPEYQVGFTIVLHNEQYRVYDADAWEEPSEAPLLPWSPPKGTKIANVGHDNKIHFLA